MKKPRVWRGFSQHETQLAYSMDEATPQRRGADDGYRYGRSAMSEHDVMIPHGHGGRCTHAFKAARD